MVDGMWDASKKVMTAGNVIDAFGGSGVGKAATIGSTLFVAGTELQRGEMNMYHRTVDDELKKR
jgi:hypothetical protein